MSKELLEQVLTFVSTHGVDGKAPYLEEVEEIREYIKNLEKKSKYWNEVNEIFLESIRRGDSDMVDQDLVQKFCDINEKLGNDMELRC